MTDFTDRIDLASERLGGAVVYANDEFFASKDNLLKPHAAEWHEGEYTDRGKWMDGWETRRRRTPGHDFCIVRLGLPGIVRGVIVDTAFFRGNFPEACSIEAAAIRGYPDTERLLSDEIVWTEILSRSQLAGDTKNAFEIRDPHAFTHLRFHIYPDGGVARLRVFGDVVPPARTFGAPGTEIDLASVEHGAAVVRASDMFFGSRHNLIMPGRGINMGDGWETKRRRTPGHEWCVVRLAEHGQIHRVEVDTLHFKGNAPESCELAICDAGDAPIESLLDDASRWSDVLPRTKLQPHTRHLFDDEVLAHPPGTHVRLRIHPEGGVSRLRLYGPLTPRGRERAGLRRLNALPTADAALELRTCCGSSRWAREVAARRPFDGLRALLDAAASVWSSMGPDDIREAFAAHPRIGESHAAAPQSARAKRWSSQEQSGATSASSEVRARIAELNTTYEKRFGMIYLVCASGRSGEELLSILERRLESEPAKEFQTAADEQAKITSLRLERLVSG